MLAVSDLRVGYGPVPVLHGVSLTVERGEIVAILGPNGAGKSTTLASISGLLRPWAGSVEFEGKPITGAGPQRTVAAGIAHVPEGRRVFPQLTVEENLKLGGWRVRAEAKRFAENLERVLGTFAVLRDRRGQLAGTLSGGEQQMLAIGRALMSSPTLLLVDEAAMGLAPVMVDRVFEMIRAVREAGATVLVVEQNAPATLALADRVYLMQRGTIVAGGPAAEMRQAGILDAYLGPMAAAARALAGGRAIGDPGRSERPGRRARPPGEVPERSARKMPPAGRKRRARGE
ncbi:MAG: ABC transporter ATP-binding protein [Acidobacteria bacterium]|nr:ABC transporter ATP-binding protein [Acidobacteriota bacterium]